VGSTIEYRGRRYDVADVAVIEGTAEGFANAVSSRGESRLLPVIVSRDGRIERAAMAGEPWSEASNPRSAADHYWD
jgi:hypothetical protein